MIARIFFLAIFVANCGALEKVRSDFFLRKKAEQNDSQNSPEPKTCLVICEPVPPPPKPIEEQIKLRLLEWQKSKDNWGKLVEQRGNTYTYKSSQQFWSGTIEKTIIGVHQGKTSTREFTRTAPADGGEDYCGENCTYRRKGKPIITEQWQEDPTTLNSHQEGAIAKTIDELYEICWSEVLKRQTDDQYIISFITGSFITGRGIMDGIMRLCDFTKADFADDGGTGVRIEEITFY